MSDDGRFVAFDLYSSGLIPNDLNLAQDVVVRDFGSAPDPDEQAVTGARLRARTRRGSCSSSGKTSVESGRSPASALSE